MSSTTEIIIGVSISILVGAGLSQIGFSVYRLFRMFRSAQLPSPQSPHHGHRDHRSGNHWWGMEFQMDGYAFCVPSTWEVEFAVIQFKAFADGMLLQLEQADTPEAYRQAAEIKKKLPLMITEVRNTLPQIRTNSNQ